MPKVSVIIASYNHARFLRENLDSILAQTYQDFEIVVVDDGSSDNSLSVLREYEQQYSDKVRIFTHEGHQNLGMYRTANRAIEEAKGDYIATQGSDDVWLPEKLEKQIQILENDKNIGAVYSPTFVIFETGALLEKNGKPDLWGEEGEHNEFLRSILIKNRIPAISLVFRKNLFLDEKPFDEDLLYSDWCLNVKLATRTRIYFLEKPLTKYRLHCYNSTHPEKLMTLGTKEHIKLLNRIFSYKVVRSRDDFNQIRKEAYQYAALLAIQNGIVAYNQDASKYVLLNIFLAVKIYPAIVFEQFKPCLTFFKALIGRNRVRKMGGLLRKMPFLGIKTYG